MAKKARSEHADAVLASIRSGFKGKTKPLSELAELEVLPTGIEVLDNWILPGGLPIGRSGVSELYSEPDVGKAQPLDAGVLTPHGFSPIGSLRVGDKIIGANGKTNVVRGVYPQGIRDVFRVVFSDGGETRCCLEHLWQVQTPSRRSRSSDPLVLSLAEIIEHGLYGVDDRPQYGIPIGASVEFDAGDAELPLAPYLLGALLGDGCLTRGAVISTYSEDLYHAALAHLPDGDAATFNGTVISIYDEHEEHAAQGNLLGSQTLRALRAFGLYGHRAETKFIPDQYMQAAIADRVELLRGLCDTDGSVAASGGTVEYSTASETLAVQVVALVRSLGGIAKLRSRLPTYTYKGQRLVGQRAYRVFIRMGPNGERPITLQKHLQRYQPTRQLLRTLRSVEPVGKTECVCIKTSADDQLYITDDYIVTHNTSLGLHFIGCAQRAGGIGTLIESENTIDKSRAPVMGADPEKIMLFEQESMENFLLYLRLALERIPDGFGPNVVVYDSLAASSLEKQLASILDKEASQQKLATVVGGKARLMSTELPVIAALLRKKRAHLCIINQIREKIGVMFGNPTTTPGGHVTKFQAALRIQLWRGKAFQTKGADSGHPVTTKCIKTKFSSGNQSAKLRLNYATGWDNEWSLINFAKDKKVLPDSAKVTAANLEIARSGLLSVPGWHAAGV